MGALALDKNLPTGKHHPQACNFIKKEALAQVLFCDFCEIAKNTFFTEHLRATASAEKFPFMATKLNCIINLIGCKIFICCKFLDFPHKSQRVKKTNSKAIAKG